MVLRRSLVVFVVLIVSVAAFFAETYYSVKDLEFAGGGIGQIEASGIGIYLRICNPSLVPISVEIVNANLTDSYGTYGSLDVKGSSVSPLSQGILQGSLDFTDLNSMTTFVNWVLNNQTNADFNSTFLVKAKILGIIPYSYEKSYDLPTFSSLVFGNGHLTCQPEQNYTNIRQQLALAQDRLSTADLLYSDNIEIYNGTKSANSTENNQTIQNP